jgi:uncharacterized membrane protein
MRSFIRTRLGDGFVRIEGTYAESSFHEETSDASKPAPSKRLAFVAVFSALVAVCTIISIPLPQPVAEITLAPAIYFALAVLVDKWDAFAATAIGGFAGELFNITTRGGSPIYPFGMIWARAPEVLIIAWAAKKGRKTLALAMVVATVYETVAFLVPDWLFYTLGIFEYAVPADSTPLSLALLDLATFADLVYIPVAFLIIAGAGPAFKRLGYRN